jgi:hypothetical protein
MWRVCPALGLKKKYLPRVYLRQDRAEPGARRVELPRVWKLLARHLNIDPQELECAMVPRVWAAPIITRAKVHIVSTGKQLRA